MRSTGSIGDRREHLRFQVMGGLSSSLLSSEPLEVLNLGTSGALVEAAVPLPVNAEFRMQVILPSHVSEVTVKVRRLATVDRTNGSARFQMGVEFLGISAEAEDAIARLVAGA